MTLDPSLAITGIDELDAKFIFLTDRATVRRIVTRPMVVGMRTSVKPRLAQNNRRQHRVSQQRPANPSGRSDGARGTSRTDRGPSSRYLKVRAIPARNRGKVGATLFYDRRRFDFIARSKRGIPFFYPIAGEYGAAGANPPIRARRPVEKSVQSGGQQALAVSLPMMRDNLEREAAGGFIR